jgi:hypothetical protein
LHCRIGTFPVNPLPKPLHSLIVPIRSVVPQSLFDNVLG